MVTVSGWDLDVTTAVHWKVQAQIHARTGPRRVTSLRAQLDEEATCDVLFSEPQKTVSQSCQKPLIKERFLNHIRVLTMI